MARTNQNHSPSMSFLALLWYALTHALINFYSFFVKCSISGNSQSTIPSTFRGELLSRGQTDCRRKFWVDVNAISFTSSLAASFFFSFTGSVAIIPWFCIRKQRMNRLLYTNTFIISTTIQTNAMAIPSLSLFASPVPTQHNTYSFRFVKYVCVLEWKNYCTNTGIFVCQTERIL